jgi:hypothetical protein
MNDEYEVSPRNPGLADKSSCRLSRGGAEDARCSVVSSRPVGCRQGGKLSDMPVWVNSDEDTKLWGSSEAAGNEDEEGMLAIVVNVVSVGWGF